MSCTRFRSGVTTQTVCEAFPEGIPNEIILGELDHREPVEGDGGLLYDAIPGHAFAVAGLDEEDDG